jgi:predicted DNA-binding ribbon-helix-helix protein
VKPEYESLSKALESTSQEPDMIKKRSVSLSGHRTSFSLEDAFWTELQAIAGRKGCSVASLLGEIDAARSPDTNLSSAIRIYVLQQVKNQNP